MKLKIKLLAICVLIFAVFSCTDFSMSTPKNGADDIYGTGKVRLCGTITMPDFTGAVPSVAAQVNENSFSNSEEKSAAFTPINYNDTEYQYFAEAKKRGTNETRSNASFEGTYPNKTFTLVLDYGYWDITAGIKKDDQIIFSDTQPVELKSGDPTQYSASFTIKPQMTESGTGKIELEMNTGTDLDIDCATVSLLYGDNDAMCEAWDAAGMPVVERYLTNSNNKFTLTAYSIKSGSYTVQIRFYDFTGGAPGPNNINTDYFNGYLIPVYSTIQTINVYDNLTTNYWVKSVGQSIAEIEPINDEGTFTLNQNIINNYSLTDIYVAQNGQDSNSGSVYKPFGTLAKAVTYINERGDDNKDYSITVDGEIECYTTIDLNSERAKSLKIKGKTSNQQDKLNGNQNGSVVTINTDVPVTFENISITGGKGTDDCGGGLYIKKGNVKLGNGLRITGNSVAGSGKGGGVYVASGAKLYMYGEALIGNSTTDNTTPESNSACSANYAFGNGGGIYNEGETYIGYTTEDDNATLKSCGIEENYGIRNNWTNGSGSAIYNTGKLCISSGTFTHNKAGSNGGAFYVTGNSATIEITGGKISSNKAGSGGALYFDGKSGDGAAVISNGLIQENEATSYGGALFVGVAKKVKFTGGTISKNKVTGDTGRGGGVCIMCSTGGDTVTKGTFEMTGGKLEANTASSEEGGAVYNRGDFIISGTASIPYGADNTTGAGKNDVYLYSLGDSVGDRTITVGTFDSTAPSTVATITLPEWKRGRKILTSSSTISDAVKSKFVLSLNDSDWTKKTASDNKSVIITSPVYVVGAQDSGSTRPDTLWGWGNTSANGAIGTKSKPFSTIEDAINLLNGDSTLEQKVVIAGTVKGNQTTGSTVNASSITIEGYNANATLNGNTNGSTLTIGAAKTFVIQQLQITGGKASAGGGINITSGSGTVVNLDSNAKVYSNKATSGGTGAGVYVASGATLNIKTDSAIYSNTAYSGNINGAGVYNAGTVDMTGGQIYNNSAYDGGGIYNAGTLYVRGTALVGGDTSNTNPATGSTTIGTTCSNNAGNSGGGIYNSGNFYLGCNSSGSSSETGYALSSGYGIRRNNAVNYGGGIYLYSGTFKSASGTVSYNHAEKGGAIYVGGGTNNMGSVTLTSNRANNCGGALYIVSNKKMTVDGAATFDSNSVEVSSGSDNASGGAVYNLGTLEISSNVAMKSNTAKITGGTGKAFGGAIYNDGILTMSAGTIGETSKLNSVLNSVTTSYAYGGAIYQGGTFNVSGSAIIFADTGTGVKNNDVYLKEVSTSTVKCITITAALNNTSVAKITPGVWKRGMQVLDGSYVTSTRCGYFSVSDTEWNVIDYKPESTLTGVLNADLWVAGGTVGTDIKQCSKAGDDDTGLGTKANPYASIEKAASQVWDTASNKTKSFTIYLDGKLTGEQQTISSSITNAKSILLTGYTGSSNDEINRNLSAVDTSTGSALKITTKVPVTIEKMTIKKGYATNGGGIYANAENLFLTIGKGTVVSENHATSSGGGIYCQGGYQADKRAKLVMTGVNDFVTYVSSNIADANGGGLYIYQTNFYMSGAAIIGALGASSAAENGETKRSNMAYNGTNNGYGGGIRAANDCEIWMGYDANGTQHDLNSDCGVCYNYAHIGGGGIYTAVPIHMNSGCINFNGCGYKTSDSGNGGGINVQLGSTGEVNVSGGTIKGNKAVNGGGIYITSGNFRLSGGNIGGSNANTNNASTNGGAIYAKKDFEIDGNGVAWINSGSANNDSIYLEKDKMITLKGTLKNQTTSKVVIVPQTPEVKLKVVQSTESTLRNDFLGKAKLENAGFFVFSNSGLGPYYGILKPNVASVNSVDELTAYNSNLTDENDILFSEGTEYEVTYVVYTNDGNYGLVTISEEDRHEVSVKAKIWRNSNWFMPQFTITSQDAYDNYGLDFDGQGIINDDLGGYCDLGFANSDPITFYLNGGKYYILWRD